MTETDRKQRLSFDDSQVLSEIVSWRRTLDEQYPGERNRLRRADSISKAQQEKAFFRLWNRVKSLGSFSEDRVALLSVVVSHVGTNVEQDLAERMSGVVNERRFDRLLETEDLDRLLTMMIRILNLIDNRVSIVDCALKLYFWGEEVKKELASEFYSHLR